MTFAATIRAAADRFGSRPVMVDPDGAVLTYRALDTRSDDVARGLRREGVGPGDVVALRLGSRSEFLVAYAATVKVGGVTTGVNPRLADREIEAVLETASPAVTIHSEDELEALAVGGDDGPRLLVPDAERPVAIVFTSGTTGRPKGAVFRERQLSAIADLDVGDAWGDPRAPAVPMLSTTQFSHIGMMTKLPWYLRMGSTIHVLDRWRPDEALAVIDEHRIPSFGGVAPMIRMMLDVDDFDRYDLRCVETMIVGGAPSAPAMIQEARDRFGAAVSNRYSSTESGGCGTAVPFDSRDEEEILHTAGRPRGGMQISIRGDDGAAVRSGEVGEIWFRSSTQFSHYWNNPAATAATIQGGWVRTGDLGSLDDEGRLRPSGRSRDTYIRGGYNVWPAEVEAQIAEHLDISEVAVVPLPDRRLGQVGVAAVVTSPAHQPPTVDDLARFLEPRLARYKHPDQVVGLRALPRTPMDKIDRSELERIVEEALRGRASVGDSSEAERHGRT